MLKLPWQAQLYLAAVVFAGAVSLLLVQLVELPASQAHSWELLVFIALAALAGGKKVSLLRHRLNEGAGSMSLGFAITFASLLKFGPGAAVVISVAACVSSCLFPKRQQHYQMAFNVGLGAFESLIGGFVFLLLNGWNLGFNSGQTLVAASASAATYFLVNTFGVAAIISLCTNSRVIDTWRENFLWTAPSYFASASMAALTIYLLRSNVTAILLCVVPILMFVYQSYEVYISRAEEQQQHLQDLRQGQENLASLYLSTIKSLALAIDAKDRYTHEHIVRVQKYAIAIAEAMGLSGDEMEAVRTGALLHDIGKLGVSEQVLTKPGKLTKEEFDEIKKHPEIGASILSPVQFPWPVLPIVRHHHEKFDGTGYPDGLKGDDIPLSARIMAVADVYDALTSTRSYREAWSHRQAVDTITKDAGTHFDPVVVEAFLKVIDGVVGECGHVDSADIDKAA